MSAMKFYGTLWQNFTCNYGRHLNGPLFKWYDEVFEICVTSFKIKKIGQTIY